MTKGLAEQGFRGTLELTSTWKLQLVWEQRLEVPYSLGAMGVEKSSGNSWLKLVSSALSIWENSRFCFRARAFSDS